MQAWDVIILGVVLLWLAAVIYHYRKKKKGNGCAGCIGCCMENCASNKNNLN